MAIPNEFREEVPVIELQAVVTGVARFTQTLRELRRDPRWWLALVLLAFVLAAIFAPLVSPYDPLLYHPSIAEQAPTWAHVLGTDALGRDQLSRVIWGTRISLSIAVFSILLGGTCGTLLGLMAAYFKGGVDQAVTILVDALLAFPGLILALGIVAALGPSLLNLAGAIAVGSIPGYARLARGQALKVASQDYVLAAVSTGTRSWKIMLKHIFPNIFSTLLVQATLSISFAILLESALSFLGLGISPPTPEWGGMITDAQPFLASDPWMVVGPALALVVILLCLNLVGDALRDRLDPRDAQRINIKSM
ncbi:MAG: ABC transporter permease [Ktedonobacteraceae bacterium]